MDLRCLYLEIRQRAELHTFLALPWLSRLTSLELAIFWDNDLGEDDLRALARRSPALTGLEELVLRPVYLNHGLAAMLEDLDFPALKRLELSVTTSKEESNSLARLLLVCPALPHCAT